MIRVPGHDRDEDTVGGLVADLTPMLDVLFILIVFFVLTANSAQLVLDLTLPSDQATAAKTLDKQEKIVLGLLPEGEQWSLDGRSYGDWEAVQSAVRDILKDRPKAGFVIAGDRGVPLQRFVTVLSFLQELGVKNTELVVQPK